MLASISLWLQILSPGVHTRACFVHYPSLAKAWHMRVLCSSAINVYTGVLPFVFVHVSICVVLGIEPLF